ncbi:MAG: AtpZ/AtpI family protein [Syntrophales bacterium]|nr:AtpZ/AtpI family protein [Syntrophales bacterium]
MTAQYTKVQDVRRNSSVLMLSAWGFVIVLASLSFMYVGYLIDEWMGTAPNFMFGLFFLAVVTSIGRLYQEAWKKKNNV